MRLAVHHWGAGDGLPLVLVHGFTGSTNDFRYVAPELAARLPVFAIGLPGHVGSEGFDDAASYTMQSMADEVVATIDGLEIDRYHLLGHSLGGKAAIVMATQQPDRIASLVLMDTSALPMRSVKAFFDQQTKRARREGIDNMVRDVDANPLVGEELLFAQYETEGGVRAHRREQLQGLDVAALDGLGRVLTEHAPLTHAVRSLRGTITVLVGADDAILVEESEELATDAPGAEFVVLEGGGHSPQRSVPAAWLAAVHAHLDRAGVAAV